jgi:hypothetical protein
MLIFTRSNTLAPPMYPLAIEYQRATVTKAQVSGFNCNSKFKADLYLCVRVSSNLVLL